MASKSDGNPFDKARENLNTMRGRIEEILHRLGQLAEGKDWAAESEEAEGSEGAERGKGLRAVYGFSVRVGAAPGGGRPDIRVEPFGTVGTARGSERRGPSRAPGRGASGPAAGRGEREQRVPVREVREPLVDVIEEDDAILVVAELPGVASEQLVWSVSGDVLTLGAEAPGSGRAYQKEVLLPCACTAEGAHLDGTNGVIELRLRRAAPSSKKSEQEG